MSAAEKRAGLDGPGDGTGRDHRETAPDPRPAGTPAEPGDGAAVELARRVFAGEERRGWEFVQPPEPPAHRAAQNPPVYTEPPDHEVRSLREHAMGGRNTTGFGCTTLLAGGVALAAGNIVVAVIVMIAIVALLRATSPNSRLRASERRLEAERKRARRDHEARTKAWSARSGRGPPSPRPRCCAAPATWTTCRTSSCRPGTRCPSPRH
ncbi:hypothetical protein ABZY14_32515 [Streptomyces sp. NPDC006617]|uniref:hypothetical protein n=1 Tax=Streptomyces sp. NPDC006617 TaxID=3155354 RepID=UPI0033A76AB1